MAGTFTPLFFVFLRKNLLYLQRNLLPLLLICSGFAGVLTAYLHWSVKPVLHQINQFEAKNEVSFLALLLYLLFIFVHTYACDNKPVTTLILIIGLQFIY